MIRVLIDGRISGHDGIGRYTRSLVAAMRDTAGPRFDISTLPPTGTDRYTLAEGEELLRAAAAARADVIHVLDYRVPMDGAGIPIVTSIHDIGRLLHPEYCYSDHAFEAKFGPGRLDELRTMTAALRGAADLPLGTTRQPGSLHEEYYGRMLNLACARAAGIVTPTRAVAAQLVRAARPAGELCVSPYGVDRLTAADLGLPAQHPSSPAPSDTRSAPDREEGGAGRYRYLLYVGQARAHKGLDVLLDAYTRSRAALEDVRLVCVGRDFASGEQGAALITERLGTAAVALGTVDDDALWSLYSGAAALCHVARYEGFGFTPLEALMAGARVIAADIPVLRETLGGHALFADPLDPDAVRAAIDRVIAAVDSIADRERRVAWARRYRWHDHARDVLALYATAAL
jgi:glycosyltransferase involved in cell wall biosynthesis